MKQIISRFSQLACFMWLCFGIAAGAFAAEAAGIVETGMVMNLEGSMTAKGTDGTLRGLKVFSKVLHGDTLFTGKDSYARVKFSDGGQISLRPASQFRIDDYRFDEKQPEKDSAGFSLLKGGFRALSGLIGKRGDPDSYAIKTPVATMGIRGTHFGVLLCRGDCDDHPPRADGIPLEDGVHLDVMEGAIIVKNAAGSQLLNAGQFGFVAHISAPPVVVPAEHGMVVHIPAKISLDKVKGGSDGNNVCPTPDAKSNGAKSKAAQ